MFGLSKAQMKEITKNTVITEQSSLGTPEEYHCTIFPLKVKYARGRSFYCEQTLLIRGEVDNIKPFGSQLERYCEVYMQFKRKETPVLLKKVIKPSSFII